MNKGINYYTLAVVSVLSFLLLTSPWPWLANWRFMAVLPALLVVTVGMQAYSRSFLQFAFLWGFILDLYATDRFGFHIFSFLGLAALTGAVRTRWLSKHAEFFKTMMIAGVLTTGFSFLQFVLVSNLIVVPSAELLSAALSVLLSNFLFASVMFHPLRIILSKSE